MLGPRLSALCSVLLFGCAVAPPRARPGTGSVEIGDSFTIESRVLGETRRINVFRPAGQARLPVLYMPDGGVAEDFHHISGIVQVSAMNGSMRPFLVVGIENTDRRRDLTGPTQNPADRERSAAPNAGGSARFREFIRTELMPEIGRRYPTTGETALVGESLAGLFALETFFVDTELFDTFIAISPSLWWNDHRLVSGAAAWLRAHPGVKKTLFIAEENERDSGGLARALAEALRGAAPPGLRWFHAPMPEESHATIFHPAALRAFRTVLAEPAR